MRVYDTHKSIDAVAVTAGTPATVWTPATGKRFVLLGWSLSCSAAAAVILKDDATQIVRTPKVAIDTPTNSPADFRFASAAKNNALKLDVSANATVSGFVYGYEVEDNKSG